MQRRLHALEETGLTLDDGTWLAVEDARPLREELRTWLDRATRGLTNLAGTLRTATELQTSAGIRQHLKLAQDQAKRTDWLQDQLGLITSILLVPTFIAGLFGANTAIPGQGHRSGFVLMVVLMIFGAVLTYRISRRGKTSSSPS